MPKYLKSRLGGYFETDPKSCELVGYDVNECKQLRQLQQQAKGAQKLQEEIFDLQDEKRALEKQLSDVKKELAIERSKAESIQLQAEARVAAAERQRQGLLRIVRERANADRNLRPKKQHSGYVIRTSKQVKRNGYKYWETQIQTPFLVVAKMDEIDDFVKAALGDFQYVEMQYSREFRSGYWVVNLWHKQELNLGGDQQGDD